MDVLDDDSENDSDYAPEPGDASEDEQEKDIHIEEISKSRKRHMDEIFADMHSKEAYVTKERVSGSLMHSIRPPAKKVKTIDGNSSASDDTKSKVPKSFKVLASIFGKTEAKKMLNMKSSKSMPATPVPDDNSNKDDAESMRQMRERALKIAQNTLTKAVVIDKVKFAGKEIE